MSVFFIGVWYGLSVLVPQWPASVRLLLLCITACAGSLRISVGNLQIAPLVIGALGLFLYAQQREKPLLSLTAGLIVALKVTFLLPVIGLLLWRGRFRALLMLLAVGILLDVAAAAPLGIRQMYAGMALSLRNYEVPGRVDYPDAHDILKIYRKEPIRYEPTPGVMPTETAVAYDDRHHEVRRYIGPSAVSEAVHWTYMFSAWTPTVRLANLLSAVCTVVALGFLFLLRRRAQPFRDEPALLSYVFCVLVLFSLLCIHRGKYDLPVVVYPFAFALAQMSGRLKAAHAVIAAVCFFFGYLMTMSLLLWWLFHVALPAGNVRLIPMNAYGFTIAFLLASWGLWRYVDALRQHAPVLREEAVVSAKNVGSLGRTEV